MFELTLFGGSGTTFPSFDGTSERAVNPFDFDLFARIPDSLDR